MGVIAVHGGAGGGAQAQEAGVHAALEAGSVALGHSALDAVCAAVALMEASGLFNAGRGAVRTSAGSVELDAAVMTGHDAAVGAIAAVSTPRHPIHVARALRSVPKPALLVGAGAEAFIQEEGLETVDPDWFVAEATASPAGTVGAVALDDDGNYAVATSTGGVRGQRPGRVGDTPIIGAGTFADTRCAISATGDGEAFMRVVFANSVAAGVQHGEPLAECVARALAAVKRLGGDGGCAAIGPDGEVVIDHNSDRMPAGWANSSGEIKTRLFHR